MALETPTKDEMDEFRAMVRRRAMDSGISASDLSRGCIGDPTADQVREFMRSGVMGDRCVMRLGAVLAKPGRGKAER